MHPRNVYAHPPDFLGLARRYPPLRPHVFLTHIGPTIDFKSATAQRRLTEALLYLDFNISFTLPDNRLCPPVPNRLNYVLWVQDIVKTFVPGDDIVRGIDIGTGASAIYPLLACRLEPKWSIVATDIDRVSLVSARQNVERNGLSDRITIIDMSSSESILQPLDGPLSVPFHFTMCNPPFYASMEEVAQSTEAKEYGPNAVCTGAEIEMVTPGGEASFVSRIFAESLRHRMQCKWYTSMLGKMSSLPLIVGLLREHEVDNYAITEFVQGQTRRWAIAWSFGTLRLPDSLARIANPTLQSIMPHRTSLHQHVANVRSLDVLYNTLIQVLRAIEGIHVTPEPSDSTNITSVLVVATEITWSRSARRKKVAPQVSHMTSMGSIIMWCRITCANGPHPIGEKQQAPGPHLVYQWIDGSERGVLESFASHINRKVTAVV
ncbi:S-adenosyl-L-methionine dependent methyltransferase [Boletus edulis BED1]|uniref:S-adenosyl-L-methionine dependent methyltransferase n=1 Tax=Boletus edulis BED1 TaxID=1328754 RepID=A0AAD4GDT2_BOLED|nr:S-adenosyl-L-methionine dependent methyltransferase [Boletus edulis BED1]